MGSAEGDADERPVHQVTLSPYWIDKYEVTVAQYRKCAEAKACAPAPSNIVATNMADDMRRFWSLFCNGSHRDRDNHPVNCVDWAMADAYCKWEGNRLPTEAEWEYAARGREGRKYPWGNSPPDAMRLNACGTECRTMLSEQIGGKWGVMYEEDDHYESTAPVGSFPLGKSPFGVFDMAGNVWEWTLDPEGPYPETAVKDPTGATVSSNPALHVIRGGSWRNGDPAKARGTLRYWEVSSLRNEGTGFRCAHSLAGAESPEKHPAPDSGDSGTAVPSEQKPAAAVKSNRSKNPTLTLPSPYE